MKPGKTVAGPAGAGSSAAGRTFVRRADTAPLAPDGRPPRGPVLVIRPRRVRWVAWICAVGMVAVFTAIASVLRNTDTGVIFRFADQVALVLFGTLLAAGVLLLTRPRVRADADGVEVRNTGWPRYLPWEVVRAVSFPDGASWARLDLPDYEYVPVLAVQAADGVAAVEAIRGLRALHAAAHAESRTSDASAANGTVSGGPVSDGPVSGGLASDSDGPVSDGPVADAPARGGPAAGGPASGAGVARSGST